jgi:hypothetical protein
MLAAILPIRTVDALRMPPVQKNLNACSPAFCNEAVISALYL